VPYAGDRRFGAVGAFEQVDGKAHFAADPNHPANAWICDLKLAPRNGAGLVEFTADLSVVLPADARQANGRCIVELPNRGRRRVVAMMNCAPPDAPVGPQAHPGDGLLFARGYTVASIGWQWDVYPSPELLCLTAPLAMEGSKPIGGETMVEIRPNERGTTRLLADRIHRPLPAAPGEQRNARLLVRAWEDGEDTLIPRSRWRFARETASATVEPSAEHVWFEDGFEPGRIYQLVYTTDRAPVAGLGLLAARDVAAFLRTPTATNLSDGFQALILYGISQTGRMQRHFLSLGLNRCEDGSPAYDGFHVHIGGARRGAFNHRFAQPSNQTTPLWGHVFPFADVVTSDPLTGRTGGHLERLATDGNLPKIISTDSAAEYWRGDAALAHIDTAGRHDLPEHSSTRRYLFVGAQHTPGYLGQSRTNPGTGTIARYPLNVLDYLPLHRAALINLDRWITEGIDPPPSRHPRRSDATAVERKKVLDTFARLPGLTPPDPQRLPFIRTVEMGSDEMTGIGHYPAQEGALYPALVSAVDADGNEMAGVRMPDITVPVGTHAGWNPRDPVTGSPEQIVPMNGLTLWFAPNEATRVARGDPRKSLAERYRDEADYGSKVRVAALRLAAERYLLEEDVERVVEAAVARYRAAISQ
jgi:hypothetical protein